MPEGQVFFANEPVIRVSGNIIETQILESFFLNTINLQTMIATKASRVVLEAKQRKVFDFSLRRAHGQDAALKVARSSYIAGFSGTSNVLAGKRYGIPVVGTMAHSFVMCFKKESESFDSYARSFPDKSTLLVDTYDTKAGIKAAIQTGKELKRRGHQLLAIRLDSGDLAALSKIARRMLDAAGLSKVKIFASGNLDEYRIRELLKKKAKIDNFGVGTKMGVSQDAPYIDVIYKISEVTDRQGNFLPTMKLSQGKTTFPGRKQVYRLYTSGGRFLKDILALEKEGIKGSPLLRRVIYKGKITYKRPSLRRIRDFTRRNLLSLDERYKKINNPAVYPVVISRQLNKLTRDLTSEIKIRQNSGTLSRFPPQADLSRRQTSLRLEPSAEAERVSPDFRRRRIRLRRRLKACLPARQGRSCQGRVVFLDIDTQYDFMHPRGKLYVHGAEKLIPRLKRIIKFARSNNIPVISSLDNHKKNDPEFRLFPAHCVKGTKGYRKVNIGFSKQIKQTLVIKNTFDIFSNPRVKKLLKPYSAAFVFGVALDYCVKAACLGLVKSGIKTYLLTDATAAVSAKGKKEALRLLKHKGVLFIDSKNAIRQLPRTKISS
ncbi:MAG: nicotinate phosphoribosyltransferase [Candidatus Omnitrophica bacterium]|nr:nicotinate phosphoribosyltransferase [Candidatus Omnitrophota bacterium]